MADSDARFVSDDDFANDFLRRRDAYLRQKEQERKARQASWLAEQVRQPTSPPQAQGGAPAPASATDASAPPTAPAAPPSAIDDAAMSRIESMKGLAPEHVESTGEGGAGTLLKRGFANSMGDVYRFLGNSLAGDEGEPSKMAQFFLNKSADAEGWADDITETLDPEVVNKMQSVMNKDGSVNWDNVDAESLMYLASDNALSVAGAVALTALMFTPAGRLVSGGSKLARWATGTAKAAAHSTLAVDMMASSGATMGDVEDRVNASAAASAATLEEMHEAGKITTEKLVEELDHLQNMIASTREVAREAGRDTLVTEAVTNYLPLGVVKNAKAAKDAMQGADVGRGATMIATAPRAMTTAGFVVGGSYISGSQAEREAQEALNNALRAGGFDAQELNYAAIKGAGVLEVLVTAPIAVTTDVTARVVDVVLNRYVSLGDEDRSADSETTAEKAKAGYDKFEGDLAAIEGGPDVSEALRSGLNEVRASIADTMVKAVTAPKDGELDTRASGAKVSAQRARQNIDDLVDSGELSEADATRLKGYIDSIESVAQVVASAPLDSVRPEGSALDLDAPQKEVPAETPAAVDAPASEETPAAVDAPTSEETPTSAISSVLSEPQATAVADDSDDASAFSGLPPLEAVDDSNDANAFSTQPPAPSSAIDAAGAVEQTQDVNTDQGKSQDERHDRQDQVREEASTQKDGAKQAQSDGRRRSEGAPVETKRDERQGGDSSSTSDVSQGQKLVGQKDVSTKADKPKAKKPKTKKPTAKAEPVEAKAAEESTAKVEPTEGSAAEEPTAKAEPTEAKAAEEPTAKAEPTEAKAAEESTAKTKNKAPLRSGGQRNSAYVPGPKSGSSKDRRDYIDSPEGKEAIRWVSGSEPVDTDKNADDFVVRDVAERVRGARELKRLVESATKDESLRGTTEKALQAMVSALGAELNKGATVTPRVDVPKRTRGKAHKELDDYKASATRSLDTKDDKLSGVRATLDAAVGDDAAVREIVDRVLGRPLRAASASMAAGRAAIGASEAVNVGDRPPLTSITKNDDQLSFRLADALGALMRLRGATDQEIRDAIPINPDRSNESNYVSVDVVKRDTKGAPTGRVLEDVLGNVSERTDDEVIARADAEARKSLDARIKASDSTTRNAVATWGTEHATARYLTDSGQVTPTDAVASAVQDSHSVLELAHSEIEALHGESPDFDDETTNAVVGAIGMYVSSVKEADGRAVDADLSLGSALYDNGAVDEARKVKNGDVSAAIDYVVEITARLIADTLGTNDYYEVIDSLSAYLSSTVDTMHFLVVADGGEAEVKFNPMNVGLVKLLLEHGGEDAGPVYAEDIVSESEEGQEGGGGSVGPTFDITAKISLDQIFRNRVNSLFRPPVLSSDRKRPSNKKPWTARSRQFVRQMVASGGLSLRVAKELGGADNVDRVMDAVIHAIETGSDSEFMKLVGEDWFKVIDDSVRSSSSTKNSKTARSNAFSHKFRSTDTTVLAPAPETAARDTDISRSIQDAIDKAVDNDVGIRGYNKTKVEKQNEIIKAARSKLADESLGKAEQQKLNNQIARAQQEKQRLLKSGLKSDIFVTTSYRQIALYSEVLRRYYTGGTRVVRPGLSAVMGGRGFGPVRLKSDAERINRFNAAMEVLNGSIGSNSVGQVDNLSPDQKDALNKGIRNAKRDAESGETVESGASAWAWLLNRDGIDPTVGTSTPADRFRDTDIAPDKIDKAIKEAIGNEGRLSLTQDLNAPDRYEAAREAFYGLIEKGVIPETLSFRDYGRAIYFGYSRNKTKNASNVGKRVFDSTMPTVRNLARMYMDEGRLRTAQDNDGAPVPDIFPFGTSERDRSSTDVRQKATSKFVKGVAQSIADTLDMITILGDDVTTPGSEGRNDLLRALNIGIQAMHVASTYPDDDAEVRNLHSIIAGPVREVESLLGVPWKQAVKESSMFMAESAIRAPKTPTQYGGVTGTTRQLLESFYRYHSNGTTAAEKRDIEREVFRSVFDVVTAMADDAPNADLVARVAALNAVVGLKEGNAHRLITPIASPDLRESMFTPNRGGLGGDVVVGMQSGPAAAVVNLELMSHELSHNAWTSLSPDDQMIVLAELSNVSADSINQVLEGQGATPLNANESPQERFANIASAVIVSMLSAKTPGQREKRLNQINAWVDKTFANTRVAAAIKRFIKAIVDTVQSMVRISAGNTRGLKSYEDGRQELIRSLFPRTTEATADVFTDPLYEAASSDIDALRTSLMSTHHYIPAELDSSLTGVDRTVNTLSAAGDTAFNHVHTMYSMIQDTNKVVDKHVNAETDPQGELKAIIDKFNAEVEFLLSGVAPFVERERLAMEAERAEKGAPVPEREAFLQPSVARHPAIARFASYLDDLRVKVAKSPIGESVASSTIVTHMGELGDMLLSGLRFIMSRGMHLARLRTHLGNAAGPVLTALNTTRSIEADRSRSLMFAMSGHAKRINEDFKRVPRATLRRVEGLAIDASASNIGPDSTEEDIVYNIPESLRISEGISRRATEAEVTAAEEAERNGNDVPKNMQKMIAARKVALAKRKSMQKSMPEGSVELDYFRRITEAYGEMSDLTFANEMTLVMRLEAISSGYSSGRLTDTFHRSTLKGKTMSSILAESQARAKEANELALKLLNNHNGPTKADRDARYAIYREYGISHVTFADGTKMDTLDPDYTVNALKRGIPVSVSNRMLSKGSDKEWGSLGAPEGNNAVADLERLLKTRRDNRLFVPFVRQGAHFADTRRTRILDTPNYTDEQLDRLVSDINHRVEVPDHEYIPGAKAKIITDSLNNRYVEVDERIVQAFTSEARARGAVRAQRERMEEIAPFDPDAKNSKNEYQPHNPMYDAKNIVNSRYEATSDITRRLSESLKGMPDKGVSESLSNLRGVVRDAVGAAMGVQNSSLLTRPRESYEGMEVDLSTLMGPRMLGWAEGLAKQSVTAEKEFITERVTSIRGKAQPNTAATDRAGRVATTWVELIKTDMTEMNNYSHSGLRSVASGVTWLSFVQYLGGSVSYYLTVAAQVPLFAMPVFIEKYGAKSVPELLAATAKYLGVTTVVSARYAGASALNKVFGTDISVADGGYESRLNQLRKSTSAYDQELLQFLEGAGENSVNASFVQDLVTTSKRLTRVGRDGSAIRRVGEAAIDTGMGVVEAIAFAVPQRIESALRLAAAEVAFKYERAQIVGGKSATSSQEQLNRISANIVATINDGYFDFSKGNRSQLANKYPVSRVITQFTNPIMESARVLGTAVRKIVSPLNKEERSQALSYFAASITLGMLVTGAEGTFALLFTTPFIKELVSAMMGEWDDEEEEGPTDPLKEYRGNAHLRQTMYIEVARFLREHTGQDIRWEHIAYGIHGNKGFSLRLARSVIQPDTSDGAYSEGKSLSDRVGDSLTGALGAGPSAVLSAIESGAYLVDKLRTGTPINWGKAAGVVPTKLMGDLARAYGLARFGVVNRNDSALLNQEFISDYTVALRAMGFISPQIENFRAIRAAEVRLDGHYNRALANAQAAANTYTSVNDLTPTEAANLYQAMVDNLEVSNKIGRNLYIGFESITVPDLVEKGVDTKIENYQRRYTFGGAIKNNLLVPIDHLLSGGD